MQVISLKDIDGEETLKNIENKIVHKNMINDEDIAVVLMNMGGPAAQDEIEPFLRMLFNDSLIIRFPFAQSIFAEILIFSEVKISLVYLRKL